LRLVAAMVPTVILGLPDKPVAVPVTLPLKLVALTTPTTLSLDVGTVDPIPTLPLESIVSAFEFAILARSLALVIFLCFLDIYGKKKRGVIPPLYIILLVLVPEFLIPTQVLLRSTYRMSVILLVPL